MTEMKYKIYQIHNNGETNGGFLHTIVEDILFSEYETLELAKKELDRLGSKNIKYTILPVYQITTK